MIVLDLRVEEDVERPGWRQLRRADQELAENDLGVGSGPEGHGGLLWVHRPHGRCIGGDVPDTFAGEILDDFRYGCRPAFRVAVQRTLEGVILASALQRAEMRRRMAGCEDDDLPSLDL